MPTPVSLKRGINGLLAVLLLAVLGLGNYLSARYFFHRLDLTRNRQYTIAPATRKIVGGLDDVVNIKVYFSRNLPEQAANIPAQVRDLLAELEAWGKGKLKIETIDPLSSPAVEGQVRALGIPRVPLTVLERNKQDTREVYLGMAILYGGQNRVLPAILDANNLEYDIVSRIAQLTRPRKTVGFLTGHGERDRSGELSVAARALGEEYDLQTVDLSGGQPVPDKVTTLIVAGPRQPLDPRTRFEIDQFVMRGGRLLALVDLFEVEASTLMVQPVDSGLVDLLAAWGLKPKAELVADWGMNEVVQFPDRSGFGGLPMSYIAQYPLWPKLLAESLAETHPVVSQLGGIVLPWTVPLEPSKAAQDPQTVVELAHSTEHSTVVTGLLSASPRSLPEPVESELKPYLLAAAITGPLNSAFAGQPVPDPAPPAPGAAPEPALEPGPRRDQAESAQVLVVGSSTWMTDSMLRQRAFSPNLVLLLNAVDWLTLGGDLAGIRSRAADTAFLDPARFALGEKLAPWLNIVVVPLLVAAFGFLWRAARRRRRVVLG